MSPFVYTVSLYAGALISCILIYYAWRNRHLANPLPFTAVMLATAEWSVAYAAIIHSNSMEAKIFWVKVGYGGASFISAAWLLFILQYTHRSQYITRRNVIFLSIVPLVNILLAWTNEIHQLVWNSAVLDDAAQFLIFTFGFWNWVFVVYSYGLILTGTILLIRTLSKLLRPDLGQIVTILLGALVPWAGNIMFISGLNPIKPLDPTPFTFTLAGIAMYWGFHRFRLLSVQPLAQSTLFDNLPDGALVLNAQDTIVMLNPAAKQLLGRSGVGRPLSELFPAAAACLAEFRHSASAQTIFSTGEGRERRYYDWRLSTLYDDAGRVNGRIITLRNITTEQQAKEHLQTLHQKTEAQTETLRRRENYWQLLNDITQAAVSAVDLPNLLQTVADKMGELIHADACHITLWDEASQRTIPSAASGIYKEQYKSINVAPGETTMTQSVLNIGHALPIEDTFNTPHISKRLADLFPDVKSALVLPFVAANEKLGAALLLFNQPHHFTPDEINWAEHAATQIALAIAKIKSNDAMKRQLAELAVFNDIAVAGAKAQHVDDLIEQATEIIRTRFYPDNFGIYLVDEKANLLRSHHSYHRQIQLDSQPEAAFDQGIVGQVATTGKPMRIGDVSRYPEYRAIVPGIRSELCVPIRADDKLIGVIDTESHEYDAYTEQDEQLLTTLAGQLATAIKKVQLLTAEQRRRKEAETLREATAVLTSTLDLNHLLNLILLQLNEVLTYNSAIIFMFQKTYAQIVAARGLPDNEAAIGQRFPIESDLFADILRTKQPIYLENAQEHPSFQGWAQTAYVRGWMGVPLIVRDVVIGYLTIDSRQVGSYGESETESALAFANQAAIAIENARLYAGEHEQRQIAETLRAANAALTQNLDFQAVLEMLLDFLNQLLPYDSAAVMRLAPDKQIVLEAHRGYEQREDFAKIKETLPTHLENLWTFKTMFDSRAGLLISDTQNQPEWQAISQREYVGSWLGMPLVVGDDVFGFFSIDKAEAGFFKEEHLQLTATLAGQTAVAIQNAQLFQEARRNAQEQETASNILRKLNSTLVVTEVFPEIAAILKQTTDCARVSLFLVDENQEWGTLITLDQPQDTSSEKVNVNWQQAPAYADCRQGKVHLTPDLSAELNSSWDEQLYAAGFRSRMNIPLKVLDQPIGALNLIWQERNGYDPLQLPLLEQIADGIALALERSRLFNESERQTRHLEKEIAERNLAELALRRRNEQLEALRRIGLALSAELDVNALLNAIVTQSIKLLNGVSGGLYFHRPERNVLEWTVAIGSGLASVGSILQYGEGLSGQVWAEGKPLIVTNYQEWPGRAPVYQGFAFASVVAVPIRWGEEFLGVLNVLAETPAAFSEDDAELLTLLANQAAIAIRNARFHDQIQRHADELEERVAERTRDLSLANRRLTELDRLKTKFISDVSHELRTPITNINLYLDLLEKGSPERQSHYMNVIREQTGRLTALIEDTLSLSRLDLGRAKVKMTAVDLNSVVEAVVTAHLPRVEMAGLTLLTTLQPSLPPVNGEPNQLAQVITNLLVNAIVYTQQGQIVIETYSLPDEKSVCLKVKDTGTGISPDDQSHVFERFYRGRNTGQSNIPGTGLGLAIVKEIVDLHEGRVRIESESEQGTAVYVHLPIFSPEA